MKKMIKSTIAGFFALFTILVFSTILAAQDVEVIDVSFSDVVVKFNPSVSDDVAMYKLYLMKQSTSELYNFNILEGSDTVSVNDEGQWEFTIKEGYLWPEETYGINLTAIGANGLESVESNSVYIKVGIPEVVDEHLPEIYARPVPPEAILIN